VLREETTPSAWRVALCCRSRADEWRDLVLVVEDGDGGEGAGPGLIRELSENI
jgi:hypothetical protein